MPQIDRRIDYIELPAADFPKLQAFYKQAFGWEFTDYGPEYCSFSDGHLSGGFYMSELKSRYEGGGALVVLYGDNLEATHDRIVESGGEICREIFSFPGGRRFHFRDTHGNELAVWSDK